MFRELVLGCLLLAMAQICACAHVERVGFDSGQHTLRYCGNKHADEDEVQSTARSECSAPRFAVLSCMREQIGAKAANFDFGSGVSVTNSRATYGVCCDVQCGN
jgi:hypothetical protein